LLYSLKSNYKIGIVSSNSKDIIIDTLKKDNIENLFEFVYSESSLFGKHLVLKKMCKKHNINPLDVIYVGDEDRDIIAAKKAGIKNIAVTWGFNSKEKLSRENPDYLVDSPMQILEVLPQK
jgi:phosphoglycolate phosphatase